MPTAHLANMQLYVACSRVFCSTLTFVVFIIYLSTMIQINADQNIFPDWAFVLLLKLAK